MRRRTMLKAACATLASSIIQKASASTRTIPNPIKDPNNEIDDRMYWINLISRIAAPILTHISEQQFRRNMPMELSPNFDNRDPTVGYLEAFGRLLAGMAPWLALPDDHTSEGKIRKQFRKQALLGIQYGVDPDSADYFTWETNTTKQVLADAAYLSQAFLRAPGSLWEPLPEVTKKRVIKELKKLRSIQPNESNWLLFAAMPETFLFSIGEECVRERIDYAVNKFDTTWYVGDGWYSDGPKFGFDHYNGYVIHCMQVEALYHNLKASSKYKDMYLRAYKRMQRYGHHLERMISPEGYYTVVGRSSTYRNAAFQPLASLALDKRLPEDISEGQVRSALTSVLKNIFVESTFKSSGWLSMGVVGDNQENIADTYTNAGSMYVASLSFLPLGLPATDSFWTSPQQDWTSRKVFQGLKFPKDYAVNY
ncbi:DUF2264 domain-containing protein [Sphingobacterium spiritivorum]|uniref:DUF2264 domain-containing protein n=1 Tax=Sphingobacterium spiritivorum TaxID=258 RepID=UPI001F160E18|nr:DUF2264 domain-containing protein [Sphingobacterium spiritivorum]